MSLSVQAGRLTPRAAVERFQEWVYHTSHPIEALITDNYFLSAHDRLLQGDVIEAYSFTKTTAQHLRILVSRSDREKVEVQPFVMSHDIGGFHIYEAPLSNEKPKPKAAPVPDDVNAAQFLELKHLNHGTYRILNGDGEVVVGDIKGHDYGVGLFGRIQGGKIALEKAKAENDERNLKALEGAKGKAA